MALEMVTFVKNRFLAVHIGSDFCTFAGTLPLSDAFIEEKSPKSPGPKKKISEKGDFNEKIMQKALSFWELWLLKVIFWGTCGALTRAQSEATEPKNSEEGLD